MNRQQKKKRKEATKEAQRIKTEYNESHVEELRMRIEQHRLEKATKLNLSEKRKLKKLKKKRQANLKSRMKKGLITEEEYKEKMKEILHIRR